MLAVGPTWILTTSLPFLTCYSTLIRTLLQPPSNSTMLNCLVFSGYNGVNPNTNPVCGKTITATCKSSNFICFYVQRCLTHVCVADQGKSTTVIVADRCAADTCTEFNLDFSEAAFQDLAELGVGRLNGVEWSFD